MGDEDSLKKKLQAAKRLQKKLLRFSNLKERLDCLEALPEMVKLSSLKPLVPKGQRGRYLFLLFLYLDYEQSSLLRLIELKDASKRISMLIDRLEKAESFYAPIGGLLGYYIRLLSLLISSEWAEEIHFEVPPVTDCQKMTREVWRSCFEGAKSLAFSAEMYPVGGAGDRLRLQDATTGEAMPVASLYFGGRTLLEWLFRDLSAREYWHYRVFKEQVRVPVLVMTSEEKNNDTQIRVQLEQHHWFYRGKKNIFIASQPLVPAVTTLGHFAFNEAFELISKPGGHGAVWKLFHDKGLFVALLEKGIEHLLIRQVNNPLSGLDHLLMSFLGVGSASKKVFGFVGVPRRLGFAEGMLVSQVGAIANIEYTEFDALQKRLGRPLDGHCPANTNILFASIRKILEPLRKDPIPGLMVNAKTECDVVEHGHCIRRKIVRLESMMQAISQHILSSDFRDPATFVGLYEREKSFSVTKRAFESGKNLHETPESCLHEWFEAIRRLFTLHCQFEMPKELSFDEFLQHGPNFIGFFHPALGPLWSVIGQKISHGTIASGSEFELEMAELSIHTLHLDGSLRIIAKQPMGMCTRGKLVMSRNVGRAYLRNVTVCNKGVKRASLKDHLNRTLHRLETCTIILEGRSEVIVEDVVVRGTFELTVPDGMRARLVSKPEGGIDVLMTPHRRPYFEYGVAWDPEQAPKLLLKTSAKQ